MSVTHDAASYEGWHFTTSADRGRDGWILRPREELPSGTKPVLCTRGLHASASPIEALRNAPGLWISRVRLEGKISFDETKACGTIRLRLAGPADARSAVLGWACECAERVLPIWDAAYPDDDRPRLAIAAARRDHAAAYIADAAAYAAAYAAAEHEWQEVRLSELLWQALRS